MNSRSILTAFDGVVTSHASGNLRLERNQIISADPVNLEQQQLQQQFPEQETPLGQQQQHFGSHYDPATIKAQARLCLDQ